MASYTQMKGDGGKVKKYEGLCPDTFYTCEAETEAQAQEKMKALLLKELEKCPDPFIIWRETP